MAVERRKLGKCGLEVPALGLGTMGMTAFYGGDFDRHAAEEKNISTIGRALELGINFFDTAWIYQSYGAGGGGNYTNEGLLGKAVKRFGREKFIIATKFGIGFVDGKRVVSGKPDFIRNQLAESLKRLEVDYVDLYYMHRMDPSTPIEETMTCLKELIAEGKIKYIGLSECSSAELRRANAVHPVSCIQMEWSLTSRDIEKSILPTARELGVGIVPYSPLGRGLLTGAVKSLDDLDSKDWRRTNPRWQEENFKKNLPTDFFSLAKKHNCTPAQLALSWVLHQGSDIVPIPGCKSPERVEENAASLNVKLTKKDLEEIEASIPEMIGERYDEAGMKSVFNAREESP